MAFAAEKALKWINHNHVHSKFGSLYGIAYHYPIYGDRSLIGRSPIALHFIVDTCTSLSRSLTLISASRWHRRAGRRMPIRKEPGFIINTYSTK